MFVNSSSIGKFHDKCVCWGSEGLSKLEEMRAEPGFPQAREIGFVPIMPVLNAVHALLSRKCCDSDLRSHGSRFVRTNAAWPWFARFLAWPFKRDAFKRDRFCRLRDLQLRVRCSSTSVLSCLFF
ncbi:hypothetical protein K0M31_007486 [Melipona bicolor]|uniref:Uncharacterized protein n=1 Tax=Melipona bicolor TaxID=60889 RepID=A0AA40GCX8_9HYME|nr:hypothetical protein K0M31_007486 [Melipona bicolor]